MTPGKPTPRISVVTPSLNQGRFLQDCLDSVAAQDWPDLEHFVIDGGSRDETLEILERNRDRLTDFVSEPDTGAANAINKGLARCTGDIVAWLNADDFYLPGAFEAVAEAWRADPEAGFWFGNGLRVDAEGKAKSVFNPEKVLYNHCALLEGLDYILQPATFMNPRALERSGLLDESLRWSFDWDLWLKLAETASPATIDARLAASREWEETLTAGGGFRRAEELRRMAESRTSKPMTHGALCYWLDTLFKITRDEPSAFGAPVGRATQELWRVVQQDMRRLGVNNLGMPVGPGQTIEPMTIGIDLYPLFAGVSGGIVPWVEGALREMVRLHPMDRVLMFHREGEPPLSVEGDNVEWVPLHEHPLMFYEALDRHCEEEGVQALVRTYPQDTNPAFPFEKQVFVIPDIQHEYFPDFFSRPVMAARRRAFAYALARGGAIATMTKHSRQTVLENPWTMCRDVFLMPAALPEELDEEPGEDALPEAARRFDRFFYMPANMWPHKNHRRLFEAFRRALPDLPENTGLVLTGNPDSYDEAIASYEDLPIVHLGFVPHEQVAALFRDAVALAYFSLFEGFGMPLLEAFRHGTPVICSNTTSLPEVGGDAVLSCDPTDVDAMAELMRRIVVDEELHDRLAEKAADRLATYDWAGPARALRAGLARVHEAPPPPVTEPLVSIVMPTRNHERFIRAAIDSVLEQDYPNIELIVRDGASTDGTVAILESYGDRIRWVSERDEGQADAINKGMEAARGEILAYLNSDDIILPGAIRTVVDHFAAHGECDMVYGEADYIDIDGNVTGTYTTAEYGFERLMQDCCVCQPAAFWRRRIAERIGPFRKDLQTAMDYEYWLRMATSGALIDHIDDRLAQSRLHEDAKTLAMRGQIFPEVFDICREHGGYVSLSYMQGFWAYRLYETWRGGPRLRRILPQAHQLPAFAEFVGQMRKTQNNRQAWLFAARVAFQAIDRRSPQAGTTIRKVWRRSPFIRRRFS